MSLQRARRLPAQEPSQIRGVARRSAGAAVPADAGRAEALEQLRLSNKPLWGCLELMVWLTLTRREGATVVVSVNRDRVRVTNPQKEGAS